MNDIKIVDPGVWKTIAAWVDAYTATLEVSTDAAMNPEIVGEVTDALKHAQSRALQTGKDHDVRVAQNQQLIANQMKKFTVEQLAQLMAIWKLAKREVLAAAWNLDDEVHFHVEETTTDRPLRFWQGEDPMKNAIVLPRDQSALVIKFLRFIEANSPKFDPREYTKAMLMKQGITEHNFHEYVDRLAITNPWAPIL